MDKTSDIDMEIMKVHNLFWESYARRDIELRFSLCAEDVTFIGSGLHERALNKSEYKNINIEGVKQYPDPFQIEFLWTNLTMLNENVACVESEVVWSQLINSELSKELLRNSTLLKCENNKWLVTHVHGSVPDYRLKVGDYMTNEQTIIRNRELERQVFERTRDLNKTLDELEQKNRELEIETALEKVRSSALAMKEPSDMVEVCRIISHQLQLLKVKAIRNIQTAIINDEKGIYLNYEYFTQYKTTSTLEIEIKLHPVIIEFVNEIKKSNDAFFTKTFEGEALQDWREYRKKTNQNADPILEEATSVYYYFYSIGPGALGISTYTALNEEAIAVFKRFRNVFELAYRRFTDIELAIAQAREAIIEAALEKVRAVAMGMTKSEDLLSVCKKLFEELQALGFNKLRNAIIHILNDKKGFFLDYDYSDFSGGSITTTFYNSHPILNNFLKQIKSAIDAFVEVVIDGYQLSDWKEFRKKNGQPDDPRLDNIPALYYYFYSIGIGDIGISTLSPIDEKQLELLKRFRNVFELAYRRFIDIQHAEAQTREAKIGASLERVRSKAMAMHSPNDLSETVNVFFKELKTLGIIPIRCGVGQIDEATRTTSLTTTTSSQQGESFQVIGKVKQTGHPVLDGIFDHWKLQKEYHPVLEGEDIKAYYSVMNAQIGYPEYPERVTQYGNSFFFKEGFVFAWTENLLSEEELIIFRRFTSVLSLTYRRYLDLKEAEERNNIIQAENDRKTKELEDARLLQLSMLPKKLPELHHLDIAVYMKTATEVGGDYYDFNIDINGTLTVVLGDATGHGMLSGMMVSIMKSFFISHKTNIELKQFFETTNNSIKDMQLGRLMMPLMGVQITSEKVIATNAGMPSLIYFRHKSQKAGEFVSHNMPLGAMKGTKYLLKEINYEKGDTLLLMSDGFAELKNENNEQYGYPRIIEEFKSVAQKSPNGIVNHLKNLSSQWVNGIEPDDDVTFVVIKVKS